MRADRSLSLAIASTILLAGACRSAPNPLAPLGDVTAALERGAAAVAQGKDDKSFAPLAAKQETAFGPEAKAAAVSSARLIGMEYELVLSKGEKPVYYLRAAVASTRNGPRFSEFKGREIKDKLYVKPHPLSAFKGSAAPLAAAAQGLWAVLSAQDCRSRVPLASRSDFDFLPAKLSDRAGRELDRARNELQAECARIAALQATKIELRVDDVVFAALSKDDKMVGMIKVGLELQQDQLTVGFGQFRPTPAEP